MTLIVGDRQTSDISIPGFAGGFQRLPIDTEFLGDNSGSVPEDTIFGENRGEPGQTKNLFAPAINTLPFNAFTNSNFIFDEVSKDDLKVSPVLSSSKPFIQRPTFNEILASNDLTLIQQFRDTGGEKTLNLADQQRLNIAIIAAAKQSVQKKRITLLDPTRSVSQNLPSDANTLSQLPGAISANGKETVKKVGSAIGESLGFITTEIVGNNLPLILIVGIGLVLILKIKG